MTDGPVFAWCFSHGALHTFPAATQPWCTAVWVPLPGANRDEALLAKKERYGDAEFVDQLPADQQQAQLDTHRGTN